jgi:hypothetical protein
MKHCAFIVCTLACACGSAHCQDVQRSVRVSRVLDDYQTMVSFRATYASVPARIQAPVAYSAPLSYNGTYVPQYWSSYSGWYTLPTCKPGDFSYFQSGSAAAHTRKYLKFCGCLCFGPVWWLTGLKSVVGWPGTRGFWPAFFIARQQFRGMLAPRLINSLCIIVTSGTGIQC